MRKLSNFEIEQFASRKGVRRIAVENFLSSMGDNAMYAGMNLSQDSRLYKWNTATIRAIREGINLATTSGGKFKFNPYGVNRNMRRTKRGRKADLKGRSHEPWEKGLKRKKVWVKGHDIIRKHKRIEITGHWRHL
jgi:hypothetical protein